MAQSPVRSRLSDDTSGEAEAPHTEPVLAPQPLAGVFTASVRITNLYVQGGPNSDVQVTKTAAPTTVLVPTGHSAIFALSDTITAIASVASTSGARVTQPVDIG